MRLMYRQRARLDTRIVDGEAFIITRTTIQHLNAVATIIWVALGNGATQRVITDLMAELYPLLPRAQLAFDIRRTLNKLLRMGLVLTVKKDG